MTFEAEKFLALANSSQLPIEDYYADIVTWVETQNITIQTILAAADRQVDLGNAAITSNKPFEGRLPDGEFVRISVAEAREYINDGIISYGLAAFYARMHNMPIKAASKLSPKVVKFLMESLGIQKEVEQPVSYADRRSAKLHEKEVEFYKEGWD